jgi:hypothetical protein
MERKILRCKFAEAGCGFTAILRQDMEMHLQLDAASHVTLLEIGLQTQETKSSVQRIALTNSQSRYRRMEHKFDELLQSYVGLKGSVDALVGALASKTDELVALQKEIQTGHPANMKALDTHQHEVAFDSDSDLDLSLAECDSSDDEGDRDSSQANAASLLRGIALQSLIPLFWQPGNPLPVTPERTVVAGDVQFQDQQLFSSPKKTKVEFDHAEHMRLQRHATHTTTYQPVLKSSSPAGVLNMFRTPQKKPTQQQQQHSVKPSSSSQDMSMNTNDILMSMRSTKQLSQELTNLKSMLTAARNDTRPRARDLEVKIIRQRADLKAHLRKRTALLN